MKNGNVETNDLNGIEDLLIIPTGWMLTSWLFIIYMTSKAAERKNHLGISQHVKVVFTILFGTCEIKRVLKDYKN